jgi:hypothetical protein
MRSLLPLISIGFVLLLGCSSDNGAAAAPSECALTDRCGGNIVGAWQISTFCFGNVPNPYAAVCPAATYTMAMTGSETFDLRADGTMSVIPNLAISDHSSVPSTCQIGTDCVALQAQINQQLLGTTCTASAAGCECGRTVPITSTLSGTYTTSGSTFTTHPSTGTGLAYSYCVKDNTLVLETTQAGMTVSMTGTK